jgi:aryl carrier-like protein
LPFPDHAGNSETGYCAPRNDVEAGLAEIWREVLALDRVGVEDNFFEIGGDSLSATRAFARMNRLFQAQISLKDMLEHPTIAALARLLAAARPVQLAQTIPRQPRNLSRKVTDPAPAP